MPTRIVQVDAFTSKPYSGNPAAVCILARAADEQWMKDVAREMNLSETAFLFPENNGYRLRWLTPAVEVDLCGHATLASAHVLWQEGHLRPGVTARFLTRSGVLTADKTGDWIEMDFPAKVEEKADPPENMTHALGTELVYVGRNQFDYLVEVKSEEVLRSLKPNFHSLAQLPVRGVIVTAQGSDYDFVSRFFAPAAGVDEDPVTGSAHTCLAPYWASKLGKSEMVGYQASPRGGVVKVRVEGSRVKLIGQAVTVLTGELLS